MGELVGFAVVAHQPTIMLPEEQRVRLGGGHDTTLVAGFARLRERLDAVAADTLVIVDTHWFTTFEHCLAGQERRTGVFTSDEVPRVICDQPFDYPGAPELATLTHAEAKGRGIRTTNVTTPSLPTHYPTLNLVHWLRRDEGVLSVSICQTADRDDFLAFGSALGEAIERSDRRVAILGSGGLSHRFWPLRELPAHMGYEPADVISDAARAADARVLDWWRAGNHAAVLDSHVELLASSPEGRFGHYIIAVGAAGGVRCRIRGEQLSDYEASVGTGQVHMWFDNSVENGER